MGVKSFLGGLVLGLAALGGVKAYDGLTAGRERAAIAHRYETALAEAARKGAETEHAAATTRAETERKTREAELAQQREHERENPPYKTASTTPADLEQLLDGIPRSYRTDWGELKEPQYTEVPANVKRLNAFQLGKAYLLLTALQNDKQLRQSIGKAIEGDLKDGKSEHGGLILYDGLALRLQKHLPTKHMTGKGPDGKEADPNDYYLHPDTLDKSFKQPDYFADYHFHATKEDSTIYAGPGTFDLQSINTYTQRRGDACGVVITKLPGKKFNVDIYFAKGKTYWGLNPQKTFKQFLNDCAVLDLGTYDSE